MFAAGLLTLYIALTAFRTRARCIAGIVILAGGTSIGWMAVVNFILASDFKWLLLALCLLWPLALVLYCVEGPDSQSRGIGSRP